MNDGGVSTGGTAVWVSRRADVKDGEACKRETESEAIPPSQLGRCAA